MLQIRKQAQYVEKLMQLPNGAWALVVFAVSEQGGKLSARAISYRLVENPQAADIIALPIRTIKSEISIDESPFFATAAAILKDLSFVKTQPTRAPNR